MATFNRGDEQFLNVTLDRTLSVPFCIGAKLPKTVQVPLLAVLMITSLVGNLFVVAVFYKNKSLRSPAHYFIANMAASDLIIPVIVLPQLIAEAFNDGGWLASGVLGSIPCKMVWMAWEVSFVVSILSMVMTAVDRFYVFLLNTNPTLMNGKKCLRIIIVIWVASVGVAFGALPWYGFVYDGTGSNCLFLWGLESESVETLNILDILWMCLTFLSAFVLTALYSSIDVVLYRQSHKLNLASERARNRAAKRTRKNTYMLVVVVAVFYAVWTPVNLAISFFYYEDNITLSCHLFWILGYIVPIMHPVLNPVIYYVFNQHYHKGIRELLCFPFKGKCIHKIPAARN